MQKNTFWSSILPALILILLAAGSFALAWYFSHPGQPEKPKDSQNGNAAASSSASDSFSDFTTDGVTDKVTDDATDASSDTETPPPADTDAPLDTEAAKPAEPSDESTEEDVEQPYQPPDEPVDTSPKRVAFTFDDGPAYNNITQSIANEFAKYGGHCTYFIVGNRAYGKYAETVKNVAAMGNEIGIHGYTHQVNFKTASESAYQSEVQQTADVIRNLTGKYPVLLRPPGGNISTDRTASSPYSVIMWSVDTYDWKYKSVSQQNVNRIVNNIMSSVKDGSIVLMHDLYANTYEAVKIVLPLLKEQGYEFVTVSELLGESRRPGTRYSGK